MPFSTPKLPEAKPIGTRAGPARNTVAIGDKAKARLNNLSSKSGYSLGTILDYLLLRQGERELLAEIKAANVAERPRGRRKTTIF